MKKSNKVKVVRYWYNSEARQWTSTTVKGMESLDPKVAKEKAHRLNMARDKEELQRLDSFVVV